MKIIYGIGQVKKRIENVVLVIGVFDGVHQGHRDLIRRAYEKARAIKSKLMVMTFDPHPVHVLYPSSCLPLLCTLPSRLKLLEKCGVGIILVVRFTKRFAALSPENFIKKYLVEKIHPKEVFVGDDFRFGQNRNGTLDYFQEASSREGFHVNVVRPRQNKEGQKKAGSTYIRRLIMDGQLSRAKKLLGYGVSIVGKVIKGDGRGTSLGFPTANIYPKNQIIPPCGVYAVKAFVGKKIYLAMANVGQRPSFKNNAKVNIEVHIFDFHQNLYDKGVAIEFIQKIRSEKKFPSQDKLIAQICKDEVKVRHILEK